MDQKDVEKVKLGPLNESTSNNKMPLPPFKKEASLMSMDPIEETSSAMMVERASSQLSSSLMNGLDTLGIISSQDSGILTDDDEPITKVSTQHFPARINPDVQLSPLSFRVKQHDPKPKTIYRFVLPNKKSTIANVADQSRYKKGSGLRMPSQKTPVVSKEQNLLPKRGRKKKILPSSSPPSESHGIFSDLRILFVRNNIDTTRFNLMKEKVKSKGGNIVDSFDPSVTHVITALPGKNVHKALGLSSNKNLEYNKLADMNFYVVPLSEETNPQQTDKDSSNEPTIGAKRTNESIVEEKDSENKSSRKIKKQALSSTPEKDFSPSPPSQPMPSSDEPIEAAPSPPPVEKANTISDGNDPLLEMIKEAKYLAKEGLYLEEEKDDLNEISRNDFLQDDDSDFDVPGDKTTSDEQPSEPSTFVSKSREGSFACLSKNTAELKYSNPNKLIIDKLQILLDHYQMRKDEWRTLSYRKAISALKRREKPVTSYEEAKKIYGIGESIASKIAEIIKTGNLRRIESISKTDKVIEKFNAIHGVGPSVALKWYAKGYRSFDDILKNVELTHTQKIAIDNFDDLQQRIPRDEVSKISKVVESLAHIIDSRLELFTVGSYRRGSPTCGDIDILITRNDIDGKTHLGILPKLVDSLHNHGLLTHDLSQPSEDHLSSRFMGICRIPGGKHRRIDLFTVPYNEFGAALLSYTGNDIFNRSLRLLARKKKMKLNSHGLYKDVTRAPGGIGLTDGKLIAQQTEIEIFDALGVPWR
ncbi:15084_t:CDS:10 [Acaulospora colombiana]|uniref:15084_t:CDS:1 n=1 Tax=Acaulospora colombiana TaxID=27376 RepID=A0ACA9LHE5_9GLOM|nr:15084_t:CDS:10 [Acaulospora colombiana]